MVIFIHIYGQLFKAEKKVDIRKQGIKLLFIFNDTGTFRITHVFLVHEYSKYFVTSIRPTGRRCIL